MEKKLVAKLKEKLEKEKSLIEAELKKFAKKDGKIKGDWDTKYPDFNGSAAGSQRLEDEADEVEEYVTLLPIEHSLETRLKDIDSALEKIKKGTYGKCGKCGKKISQQRLKVYPSAEFCKKCQG